MAPQPLTDDGSPVIAGASGGGHDRQPLTGSDFPLLDGSAAPMNAAVSGARGRMHASPSAGTDGDGGSSGGAGRRRSLTPAFPPPPPPPGAESSDPIGSGVVYVLWDIENTQVPRFTSSFSPTDMRLQLEEALAGRAGLPTPLDLEIITFYNVKAMNGFEPTDADVRWMRAAGVVIQHMGDKSGAADLGLKQEVDKILRRHRQGLRVSAVVIMSSDSDFADKLRELTLNNICSVVVHGPTANRALLASARVAIPWGEVSTRRGGPPAAAGGPGHSRRGTAGTSPTPGGEVASMATAGARARECTFWRTPGGCNAGDRCPYRHVGASGVRRPPPVRLSEHVDRAIAAGDVAAAPLRGRSGKRAAGDSGDHAELPPAADAAAAPVPGPPVIAGVGGGRGGGAGSGRGRSRRPPAGPPAAASDAAVAGDGDIVFVDGGIMLNGTFVPLEDVARAASPPPPPPPPAAWEDEVGAPAVAFDAATAARSFVPEVARLFDEAMQKATGRLAGSPLPGTAPPSPPAGSGGGGAGTPVPPQPIAVGRPVVAPRAAPAAAPAASAGSGGRAGQPLVARPPPPAAGSGARVAPAVTAPAPAATSVDAELEAQRARWQQLASSLTNTVLQCSPHLRFSGQVRVEAWLA